MPLIVDVESPRVMHIDEFVSYLQQSVDFKDFDSIAAAAAPFRQLLSSPALVMNAINRELENWRISVDPLRYIGPSVWLHRDKAFSIRANFWMPVSEVDESPLARELIAYQVPHNHPKMFMTGGYRGSGYETALFDAGSELERKRYIGDVVDLQFVGRERLSAGAIMLYHPTRDVHYQEHPKEFSISINLISEALPRERQYLYDVSRKKITDCVGDHTERAVSLLNAARVLHDDCTLSHLEGLLHAHENPQVRIACARVLLDIDPSRRDAILAPLKLQRQEAIQQFVRVQEEAGNICE